MLKPLTLSLSLAVALGFTSVSMAGGHDGGCSTCGLASPQGGPIASAQGPVSYGECAETGHKKCNLFHGMSGKLSGLHCKLKSALHPPVTYEWVLKKKRLWGHKSCGGCGESTCDSCGGAPAVYPTGQVAPSGQGYAAPSGQGYAAPQAAPVYGAGQHAFKAVKPAPTIASVPAEMTPAVAGEEAPPAPEVNGGGLLLPTPAGN
ncbi:hypothetical protein OJF2_42990 [Aquisphaera giovannonii]|uniref:Uncharacterized protein n=1 Tax=Aquisphaera giovannonii TaxID=406548 RepID=A0A5B9W557_9BACT|nr:hypothetical protein [Aquisphaera giovannonii]QEH35742.1 hypothetical protein OJF2_42990 [Aquisphaera giovannonii]